VGRRGSVAISTASPPVVQETFSSGAPGDNGDRVDESDAAGDGSAGEREECVPAD
jgi:hypothetical protein